VVGASHLILLVLLPLMLAVDTGAMVAFPFGNQVEYMHFMYWVLLIAIITTTLAMMLFSIAVAVAKKGLFIASLIFFVVAMAWHLVELIYMSIILATCDGDLYCADNLTCDGTVSGAYGGPTSRFLAIFAMSILFVIIHFVGILISWTSFATLQRAERRTMEDDADSILRTDAEGVIDDDDGDDKAAVGAGYSSETDEDPARKRRNHQHQIVYPRHIQSAT
jgi:hypothetical protein